MPQLDTSTWSTTIMTMLPTLYLIMQLKLLNMNHYQPPLAKNPNLQAHNIRWRPKWTKTYLPHSQPQQF
uniref:ATP synthase complex subunit 8 n=1 Tax=Macaca maura TaxID=90383 RepID=A0A343CXR6_MACMR|nr:ATP synthase F0 subunit 8 [Macaca maura]QNM39368.1 ATP synthase F0 subunit 8 [Macaca maura]QNM39381.1 ATP synthase F0 subunit 8 [Macaca maura]QNM39394.1 ATP synthase F0 subunit 8 [Macaca maura]QNM39407.1 ATP synthase F0 subunit 8 [Macaca maura]